jgi:hypothetical protein
MESFAAAPSLPVVAGELKDANSTFRGSRQGQPEMFQVLPGRREGLSVVVAKVIGR